MTKEELMMIINNGLSIDRKAVKAQDVVARMPKEVLVALISFLIGKCEN